VAAKLTEFDVFSNSPVAPAPMVALRELEDPFCRNTNVVLASKLFAEIRHQILLATHATLICP
jgi:hypothetical protein